MTDELLKAIQARLLADGTLCGATPALPTSPYPGLAKGGVYDRRIRREGFGTTPRAYDTDLHVRPSIILSDMEGIPLTQIVPVLGATSHMVKVTCIAPAHNAGKAVLSQMSERAMNVLLFDTPDAPSSSEPWIPVILGKRMFPYFNSTMPRKDSEEYPQVVEESFIIEYRFIRRHPQL